MSVIKLLYQKEYPINDKIKIVIPTVGEIIDDEEKYNNVLSILTSEPYDMMVQLDDLGIDFTKINAYEMFLLYFPALQQIDTHLFFGDLDLKKFKPAINEQNGLIVLINEESDVKIDKAIFDKIAMVLRNIHHLEKNTRKPANEEAKKYLLEKERKVLKRRKNKANYSQLESLITALVCTEQFKYDFNSVRDLTIYQFNECVHQIMHKIDYDNRMIGVYAGTISVKDMKQDDLIWVTHK